MHHAVQTAPQRGLASSRRGPVQKELSLQPVKGHREPTAALPEFWTPGTWSGEPWRRIKAEQTNVRSAGMWGHKSKGEPELSYLELVSSHGRFLAPSTHSSRVSATPKRIQERLAPRNAESLQLSSTMGSSLPSLSFPTYFIEIRSLPAGFLNSAASYQLRGTNPQGRTLVSSLRRSRLGCGTVSLLLHHSPSSKQLTLTMTKYLTKKLYQKQIWEGNYLLPLWSFSEEFKISCLGIKS